MEADKACEDIETIIWQIRAKDPSTYFAIVNMHLSFVTEEPTNQCDGKLDLPKSNSSKWNLTPILKKFTKGCNSSKNTLEGAPLTEEGVCQVYQLTSFLRKIENRRQEGLFRKPGSHSRQHSLKNFLHSGLSINLESGEYTAHDCASVLKSFLADLPEPLLQEECYHVHCRIAAMYTKSQGQELTESSQIKRINALQLAFLLLPPPNYKLLKDLLLLLHDVAMEESFNKMPSTNLGTMFAPHILFPRKLPASELQDLSGVLRTAVAFMIDHAYSLFQIPSQLEADLRGYWKNRKNMPNDGSTKTLYTFVDQKKSAEASNEDVTSLALAELYAYVQTLPESAQKDRLIKKFNEANGQGTPQMQSKGNKLGNSIKKHLFSKSLKSKNLFPANVKTKRSNSSEILSPTSCCSPEVRFFRKTPSKTKSKSLDELSPKQSVFFTNDSTPSTLCADQCTPVSSKIVNQSKIKDEVSKEPPKRKMKFSHSYGTTPSSPKECKPIVSSLPELQSYNCDGTSPISFAVNKSHLQQFFTKHKSSSGRKAFNLVKRKVMLTPRCRKPIIMNSTTSLSGINVQSKTVTEDSDDESPPIKKTSSAASLLGGLFKHLSTSSLMQLATKLTNTSQQCNETLSPCLEALSPCREQSEELDTSHNEFNDSLSNVFKEYLLGRSLLTDNPIDLSNADFDSNNLDSAYESLPKTSQESLVSPNVVKNLSESLIHCLDGNDPLEYEVDDNLQVCSSSTPIASHPLKDITENDLHTCTSTGRRKLFRNKNGTPIPQKDANEPIDPTQSITFETSF